MVETEEQWGEVMEVNDFQKSKIDNMTYLNKPILRLGNNRNDILTVRDCLTNLISLGSTGSGKTSGTLKHLMMRYFLLGWGGVLISSKNSDTEMYLDWIKYVDQKHGTNRIDDVIIFSEEEGSFRPLEYAHSLGESENDIYNQTNLLFAIHQLDKSINGIASGGSKDSYWDNSLRRLINNMLLLLQLSEEIVTFDSLYKLLISLPSRVDYERLGDILKVKSDLVQLQEWSKTNYFIKLLYKSTIAVSLKINNEQNSRYDEYLLMKCFFLEDQRTLPDKTKFIIHSMLHNIVSPFQTGILKKSCASKPTNIKAEMCYDGKIIIIDFSIKKYDALSKLIGGIIKYQTMKTFEKRIFDSTSQIPVFLVVDEFHNYIHPYDSDFYSTCRSTGVAVINVTQNINGIYAKFNSQAKAKSLIANHGVRFLHSNIDFNTNEFFSNSIGREFKTVMNQSLNPSSTGVNLQNQWHYKFSPSKFSTLRNGGYENDLNVDCIITIAGKTFANKQNYLFHSFKQS